MTAAPLPDEPLPVELMNTVWADHGVVHDKLGEPGPALAWLRTVAARFDRAPASVDAWLAESAPAAVTDGARELRRLRDALRRLAAITTRDSRSAAASAIGDRDGALAVLNHACTHAPTWSQLHWPAPGEPYRRVVSSGSAAQAIVSMFAELAVELFAGDDRERLRACLAPGCVRYFVTGPPRREWCSPGCGNRARVARHYRRRRQ